MRIISNTGTDRVVDIVGPKLLPGNRLDLASQALSLFAFGELAGNLARLGGARLILPNDHTDIDLLGSNADRTARNRLQGRWLASRCAAWIEKAVEVRKANGSIPQGAIVMRDGDGRAGQALLGSFSFSTHGLGLTPGNPLNLIQASETPGECDRLGLWFDAQWSEMRAETAAKQDLVAALQCLAAYRAPSSIYGLILHHLFQTEGGELDEERVVKSATGIRDTEVWKRLFKFQRDGVVGAIDKLEQFGGCIIADSVGLGKTFEALAIIKYHELRNDRVLVLCPKRLRDNWTLYRANDRRNFLAGDRFNYDILNHTDLSRDGGLSGDIDLSHVNWGNYDLVVIDESHNFRNKRSPRQGGETRYDRLMHRIVRDGVKTSPTLPDSGF
jgi:SNF2 family DNA or RNA helicase